MHDFSALCSEIGALTACSISLLITVTFRAFLFTWTLRDSLRGSETFGWYVYVVNCTQSITLQWVWWIDLLLYPVSFERNFQKPKITTNSPSRVFFCPALMFHSKHSNHPSSLDLTFTASCSGWTAGLEKRFQGVHLQPGKTSQRRVAIWHASDPGRK